MASDEFYAFDQPRELAIVSGSADPADDWEEQGDKPEYNCTNIGYDQPTNLPADSNNVIVTQPQKATVIVNPKPTDFMIWSVCTLCCCCLPIGIAALVYSCNSRAASEHCDFDTAREAANTARNLNILGLVCGLTIIILLMLYIFDVYRIGSSRDYYDYYDYGR